MNDVYNYILIQDLKKLPKHGQSSEFEKSFKGASDALELGKNLQVLDRAQKTAETLIKSLSTLEARALGIQKGFNLTTVEAKKYAIELTRVANKIDINSRLSKQYITDLGKLLPGQIKNIQANKAYSKELQFTNDILRNRLGLDAKQAFSIRKLANLQGKSVAEVIKDAEKINQDLIKEQGYAGGLVDILSEMANLNSDIAIQYGRDIPGSLQRSVISAKKFGLTLNDLYKTGQNLLDVENATNSAVEYQIFTGKKLEGQKYKNIAASYNQATLESDSEKQMDIILDLVKTQGYELKNNFKAREATAKMLGLETSQITDILSLQEEYAQIGVGGTGTSEGIDATDPKLLEIIANRSTQTTLDKYEDQREIVKDTKVVEFDDAGKQDLTPDQLLEGGKNVIDLISKSLDGASFAIKIANLYGTYEFTAEAVKNLIKGLTTLGGGYDQESPGAPDETPKDAFIRVNDTIMFDPNDKINIMASTSQGSLDKATANMGGGSSNNTSNIGQQVANAIAGMSFVVNNSFNGEDIITQMEIIQENQMNA